LTIHGTDVEEPINRADMHPEGFGNFFYGLSLSQEASRQILLLGIHLLGAANRTPRRFPTSRPARVRSRINSRSNSAMPAKTVRMNFPPCEVVSAQGSDNDRNVAPAARMVSTNVRGDSPARFFGEGVIAISPPYPIS
jgi:hypothetical protein